MVDARAVLAHDDQTAALVDPDSVVTVVIVSAAGRDVRGDRRFHEVEKCGWVLDKVSAFFSGRGAFGNRRLRALVIFRTARIA